MVDKIVQPEWLIGRVACAFFDDDVHIRLGYAVFAADEVFVGRVLFSVDIPKGHSSHNYELAIAQDPRAHIARVVCSEIKVIREGRIDLATLRASDYPFSNIKPQQRTVRSALEDGIHEMESVEKWRREMIEQHGELSPEMESLFAEYRKAVHVRSMSRFERELADILGMEAAR